MPTSIVRHGGTTFVVTEQSCWKKGDQPPAEPSDYLGWHAWAEVQHKAGLRQKQCGCCGGWWYPQEMSGKELVSYAERMRNKPRRFEKVKIVSSLCKDCDMKRSEPQSSGGKDGA